MEQGSVEIVEENAEGELDTGETLSELDMGAALPEHIGGKESPQEGGEKGLVGSAGE